LLYIVFEIKLRIKIVIIIFETYFGNVTNATFEVYHKTGV